MLRKPILKAAAHHAASVTALPMFAALAILAVSGAVQYADEPGQVTVLNPKSYPPVGGHWTVNLDLASGGNLAVAAVDGTYFGDDIGFARMYGQGGADVQPSYRDDGTVRFDGIAAGSWHFEVAVYTAGGHDMVFELGGSTARASNNALMPGAFVTTWQTTSAGETITIPISIHPGSYTVAWGDGSVTTHTSHATHTYASAGNHTVSISGNDLTMRLDSDINNAAKLVSIDQWGDVQWKSMHRAFYRASNMVYSATDAPDLSGVTDMSYMFAGASAFDGDLSAWDVSGVRKMPGMFWEAPSFNGNVSTWDVSGVTDMYNMFNGASKFNGDLSAWDVSRVTNMGSTFARAPVFDSDLSDWDVSRVKSMNGMFKSANAFNSDLSAWDVSRVTDMERLFSFAYVFDGDISAWDVSSVTDMGYMFNHADSFNGDISAWDVSRVTDMGSMFWENAVFNGNLSAWDVSGVTDMKWMFAVTHVFNGDISAWDVSGVTDMERMFSSARSFNGDISAWDVSGVTDMERMFSSAQSFNGDISAWDVSSVTDMENMFSTASDFEQNLGNWYIALNNTSMNTDDAPGIVGTISAQNRYLDNQNPTYGIGAGGDAGSFEITGGSSLDMTVSPTKSLYTVNITSTGSFGTSNYRVYNITVPAAPTNPVPVTSFGNGDSVDGASETFNELSSPYYVTTVKIGSGTYALVTSHARTGGVQIIDITDPANPVPAASFDDNDIVTVDGTSKAFDELQGAKGIATTTIGTNTYALVAAYRDDGVQIVDITDPANPVPAASFDDGDTVTVNGADKTFDKLKGAHDITAATVGSGTYALVTAYYDHGVQIINITDPANPVPAASFGNNDTVTVDGTSKTFDKLKGAEGIATATIGTNTYALVASYHGHGIQIIDITDPANPAPAASFGDGDRVDGVSKAFDELRGANGITTVTIGPDTYALVTAYDDDGVQIVDITDPANPIPTASFGDGTTVAGKTFDKLDGAFSIATATIGPGTYALVTAVHGNGIQIIDITDPANPVPAASVGQGDSFDGKTFDRLTTPRGIAAATIDANAYALVAAYVGSGIQIIDLGETPDTTAPPPDGSFVTTWKTTSAGETITIPVNNAMGIYTVHWGDGSATTHTGDATHTYAAAGSHTVHISGDFTRIYLADDPDNAKKLASIDQWGDVRWESMNEAFYGASNIIYSATDAPDLSGVTDMPRMFGSASSFDGDLSAWDVSSVTDMGGMFNGASSFDGDLSAWDVSDVTDMSGMFNGASSFDGDLSAWDVSSVTDMGGMFNGASSFDGDLSAWDVSDVTDMSGMFNGAISFNQDLSAWDVSSVTDMGGMFNGASAFRQNLGNWYVALDSTVIHADDAPGIVGTISAQNQYLDNQNPAYRLVAGDDSDSFVITGGSSLSMTVPPDKSLYTVTIASTGSFGTSNHRVYNVTATNLNTAFSQSPDGPFATTWKTTSAGEAITIPVGNAAGNYTVHWGDGSVTTHRSDATHAYAAAGNHAVRISGDFTRIYLADDSDNAAKLVSIDQWGDVRWESMNGAFRGASNMIYNATDVPDLSRVWDVSSMFRNAASFDGDLSAWDVSGVTYMYGMFFDASSFDGDLSAWDVSGVTSMGSMFRDAASFDGDLSAWDVSGVTYMYGMFRGAASFDSDLSAWDVSDVTDMHSMFRDAASFDSDLSAWDVSSTTTMGSMFADASAFRQNLGNWYVALDGTVIHADDAPGIVGAISAQNRYLDNQNPAYGIGAGDDSDSFEITGGSSLNMTVSPTKSLYAVNITSTGSFGTSNHRVYNITVTPSSANSQSPDGSFVTTWKTTSAGETITIPVGNAAGDYTVHWGDGSVTTHTSDATHTYAAAGNHTVRISGDFTRIYLADDSDNAAKLVSIDQWGDVRWESMNGAFRGASSMIYNATDVPDLSGVRDVSSMFRNAASFDGDLSAWDVSGVTSMHSMFRGAASFDGDLSAWDVSGVTNMHSMFRGAASFDGDLSAWDVSDVTYMYNMFRGAASFDSDLSAWDVPGVANMHSMFADASAFRQNLGNWYIVLDNMTIDYDDAPGVVGSISAQNSFLDGQNPVYGTGPGGDSDSFELNGSSLVLKAVPAKRTYAVNVTSTGDFGPGNSKMIEITVSGFNTLPTVDAGEDQTVREGHTVTLSGTAAGADGDTLTYEWTHDSALAITITGSDSASASFTAPDVAADTTITVTLTVNDGTVDVSDALQVNITDSPNSPPAVEAGADQEAAEGATVTLSGTVSDDDPEDALTYEWTHDSALAITITGSDSASASFTAPDVAADTTITVTLTVNDGTVDVSDTLQVNITDSPNSPPAVEAGADQEVVEGATVTLSGTVSDDDPEDALTYSWIHDGPSGITFANPAAPSTTFAAPDVAADTTITVTLTVNDGTVDVSDALQVNITDSPNSPPAVEAGADQEAAEGATVTLSGTVSDDDPEDALTYEWTHDSALAITITGSDSASASFTAPDVAADTTITVTLTVNDGTVDVSDALQVNITDSPNSPPAVEAGADQEAAEGATVTLSGTVSDDDPEDALTYSWIHDGPSGITFANPAALSTTFAAPDVAADTTITVTLTVNDGTVDVSDTLQVTVTDSPGLNLAATDSITDAGTLVLDGAYGIATFTSGGNTYVAVAAYDDDGVQILDVTDPSDITAAGSIGNNATLELDGAYGIATFTSGGSTYVAVASFDDDGVQILDVTDPSDITATDNIGDTGTLELDGAWGIATFTSGGSTYVAVAAYDDDGVQILDVTDPSDITAAGSIGNNATLELDGAYGIATFTSGGSTYAAVASFDDDGVQILDVTDPSDITATDNIGDTATLELDGAWGIATFTSGGSTYAAVAAYDDGVQILNITDPFDITAADSIGDTGTLELDGAYGIATFTSGGSTYAAVAAANDDGVQILDVTDPSAITAADNIADTGTFELNGARGITTFTSGGSTYAAVTAALDDGVQILRLTDSLPAVNSPPAAEAGGDQEVAEGATVALSGTATDDDPEDTLTYSWTHDSALGITFANPAALSTSFTAPNVAANTTITVTLTVNDGTVDVSDTLQVTVTDSPNSQPAVEAGGDQEVAEGATVALSGTATDDDPEDTLTYSWTHDSALGITFANPAALSTSFTAPNVAANTTITVTLTVNDGTVDVSDTLQVTVTDSPNSQPAVEAGGDQEVAEGATVALSGTATDDDPEDTLTYSWTHDSALGITFANPAALSTSFTAPNVAANTTITVTLTVNDGTVDVSDTLQVTVTDSPNSPPAVEAGGDQEVAEGATVALSGTATDDDPEDTLTYSWTHDSALGITFANPAALSTSFTAPNVAANTTITVTLTVNDGTVDVSDTLQVTITDSPNSPPAVEAGGDQEVAEGATVALSGTATDDDPEDTLTYSWTHDSALGITFANPAALSTSFTAPNVAANTTITVTLTVNDGTVDVSDTLQVTITDSPNSPPAVEAGGDQEVAEGATVALSGTATDDDPEDTLTYSWTHDSALAITIAGSDSASASFTAPDAAADTTITVTLTVNDGTVDVSDALQVTVTVSPNSPPVVEAGADQTVGEGGTVTLTGTATDADEDPMTYLWSQTAGSPTVVLIGSETLSPVFTAPPVPSDTEFAFELAASDGLNISNDTVKITVRNVPDSSGFVTTWQTTFADESITIPVGGASGTYTVDWGDGNTSVNVTGDQTHTYDDAGTYTVRISGDFTRIHLNGQQPNADKLQSIERWGDTRWESMGSAFHGASNVVYNATDIPVLSDVTTTRYMFYDAKSFSGDLSGWDVSRVTDMFGTFWGAESFSGDLSGWDVSRVTNMKKMLSGAKSFNADISGWDVSRVTDMSGMFHGAESFNADISGWDVSSVTDMSSMFLNAESFNADISGWDVSSVTTMFATFMGAESFNADISGWDVSGVTNMHTTFRNADSFNADISGWDVSGVTSMSDMFMDAASFNADISGWDVSGVTNMHNTFRNADSFNRDISAWDVSGVTNMNGMFYLADAFEQNLGNWYVALDSTVIHADDAPGIVGAISAQNQYLDNQNPAYGIGAGGDAGSFEITGGSSLNMTVSPTKSLYTVNITSTGSFGTSNYRVYNITVTPSSANSQSTDGSFVTTWKTTSAGEAITIPVGNAAGNYTVRWGDGSVTTHTSDATHTYAAAGNHTVRISGDFTRIYLADDPDNAAKLVSIDQWGDVRWESMNGAFRGASNMTYNATDAPDLSGVRDASSMFRNAASFDGDLSAWDVSGVTSMHSMFRGAASFDSDLSAWDVSDVTYMYNMFRDATSFDGDLSAWDVSGVTSMGSMFRGAASFDGDLSAWNVSGVTDMHSMFRGAASFDSDLSEWDVSSITTMGSMFTDASAFRQNLGNWYVALDSTVIHADDAPGIVGTISAQNRYLDNQNPAYRLVAGDDSDSFEITGGSSLSMTVPPDKSLYTVTIASTGSFGTSNHRVYNVTATNLNTAFSQSPDGPFATTWKTTSAGEAITIPVGNAAGNYTVHWGDGNVTTHRSNATHAYAAVGNHTVRISGDFTRIYLADDSDNAAKLISIDQWGDVRWKSMNGAFYGASNMTYSATDAPDLSRVTDMSFMFGSASSFDVNLSAWDVSSVTDMTGMFAGASAFGGNLSAWDVSRVTDMTGMFAGASAFGGNLSAWDVSRVTDMTGMFNRAPSFDGNLSAWDVSSVTHMNRMFGGAYNFDGNLSAWDVSNVESMNGMFGGASKFNGSLSAWDVSNVESMNGMFGGASKFNGSLSAWDVSNVESMNGMFRGASSFNGNISTWDVSGVVDMTDMFAGALTFDGNLSAWDVSSVTDMGGMFLDAAAFNGDLSSWDVSNVESMNGMFWRAFAFDGNLSSWDVSNVEYMRGMFFGASAFDGNLSDWDVSSVTDMDSMFNGAINFNQDLSAWDVSSVTYMNGMFTGASAFRQNLGNWHVVLDDTVISNATETLAIRAQNSWLDSRNPTYGLGTGGDSDLFVITGGTLGRNSTADYSGKTGYSVSITSTGDFGTGNHRVYDITVTGEDTIPDTAPTVTSIERSDPAAETTSAQTLVFAVTFSEDVTGVDQADFVLSSGGTGTGSVTNLAGSGSQYLVNVSAAQDGTYNLDLVPSGHGITDTADNPLSSPTPTGADHTYAVDTAAPTVASIARSDPAEATTSERTLVFAVTFSEDVTGVDLSDFALSPDSAGTGSVTNLAGSGSQYLVNVSAAQDGTYNLDLVPSGHGITDTADNPLSSPTPTGADHTYAVDTAAPTVASIARSDPAEATTSERTLVFAVTFSEDVTGVDLSDFALSPDSAGTGSVTNLAGSGSQYLVNVSAAQDGTYNLDLVPSGHGITDTAGQPALQPDPDGRGPHLRRRHGRPDGRVDCKERPGRGDDIRADPRLCGHVQRGRQRRGPERLCAVPGQRRDRQRDKPGRLRQPVPRERLGRAGRYLQPRSRAIRPRHHGHRGQPALQPDPDGRGPHLRRRHGRPDGRVDCKERPGRGDDIRADPRLCGHVQRGRHRRGPERLCAVPGQRRDRQRDKPGRLRQPVPRERLGRAGRYLQPRSRAIRPRHHGHRGQPALQPDPDGRGPHLRRRHGRPDGRVDCKERPGRGDDIRADPRLCGHVQRGRHRRGPERLCAVPGQRWRRQLLRTVHAD